MGFAIPWPAMSGADPWTGSNRPGPPSPRLADGSIPIEPVIIAASSLRMSPNMFSVTMTSKSLGRATSCIAALSTSMWSSSIAGCSAATSRTTSRHSRELSSTLALSTEVTLSAPAGGGAEAPLGDATDLGLGIQARVVGGVAIATALAEVDPAGQLADDEQVGAVDALAPQRAGVVERREGPHGAQVGEQSEAGPQREQRLLRAGLVGSVVSHLGPPTAPSSTASAALHASSTPSGRGLPYMSMSRAADRVLLPRDRQIVIDDDGIDDAAVLRRRPRGRSHHQAGRPLSPYASILPCREPRQAIGVMGQLDDSRATLRGTTSSRSDDG